MRDLIGSHPPDALCYQVEHRVDAERQAVAGYDIRFARLAPRAAMQRQPPSRDDVPRVSLQFESSCAMPALKGLAALQYRPSITSL
jgi:hypothetical protein